MPSHDTDHLACPVAGCDVKFNFFYDSLAAETLKLHKERVHRFTYCTECDILFDDPGALRVHKYTHHICCHLCPKSFKSVAEREKHFRSTAKPKPRKPETQNNGPRPESTNANAHGSQSRSHQKDNAQHERHGSGSKPETDHSKPSNKSKPINPPPAAKPSMDYYTLIGISYTATHDEVVRAGRKARVANHPDRFIGKNISPQEVDEIVERSKCVGQACDVLEDPPKRRRYDAKLRKEILGRQKMERQSTQKENKQKPNASPRDPNAKWSADYPFARTPEQQQAKSRQYEQKQKPSQGWERDRYNSDRSQWPGTPPQTRTEHAGTPNPFGKPADRHPFDSRSSSQTPPDPFGQGSCKHSSTSTPHPQNPFSMFGGQSTGPQANYSKNSSSYSDQKGGGFEEYVKEQVRQRHRENQQQTQTTTFTFQWNCGFGSPTSWTTTTSAYGFGTTFTAGTSSTGVRDPSYVDVEMVDV